VLWVVGVGVFDAETEFAVVKAAVVDAVVCAGDEIDVMEDALSPLDPPTELDSAAEGSLSTISLSTTCALARVMTTSKRKNTREACVMESMMSKVCGHSQRICRCLEKNRRLRHSTIGGCHKSY
jgi:hypothetical protein